MRESLGVLCAVLSVLFFSLARILSVRVAAREAQESGLQQQADLNALRERIHDLGETEVKHGFRVRVFSFH